MASCARIARRVGTTDYGARGMGSKNKNRVAEPASKVNRSGFSLPVILTGVVFVRDCCLLSSASTLPPARAPWRTQRRQRCATAGGCGEEAKECKEEEEDKQCW